MLDLKAATTTLIVFIALIGPRWSFPRAERLRRPGTWLDDNLGTPSVGYGGVAVLALITVIFGLAFRHVHLRLRHHPMYGKGRRR
jgi:hypothetical protein